MKAQVIQSASRCFFPYLMYVFCNYIICLYNKLTALQEEEKKEGKKAETMMTASILKQDPNT